jgi:hypothetical protein
MGSQRCADGRACMPAHAPLPENARRQTARTLQLLTFIIPVRHHANARDWPQLVDYLRETVGSLERQASGDWRCVIVANEASDLPSFSSRVAIHRVDFPPNPHHDPGSTDLESFRDAVRLDKGRRVLAGMRAAGPTDYFMTVDDDDYLSNRVAGFVAQARGEPGWFLRDGYVWTTGGRLLYRHDNFNRYCGTSHIVRRDLLDLGVGDDEAGIAYVKRMLGSHIAIADALAQAGTPLLRLPFPGAVYRIGHASAHSQSPSLLRQFLFNRSRLADPRGLLRSLRRFRLRTARANREFFGPDAD